jgi:hypothetical protein
VYKCGFERNTQKHARMSERNFVFLTGKVLEIFLVGCIPHAVYLEVVCRHETFLTDVPYNKLIYFCSSQRIP